ncbi:hypothetical protein BASA81_003027 [Batrachochytrium salamandrivorans]|nr:hypothetical protein BASA81_003027 [Batrachochytrium salamandrivorans]
MASINSTAFQVFARQLKLERDLRQQRFDASTPGWRSTPPTWQEWHAPSSSAVGSTEQAPSGEQTPVTKETNKPVFDLIFDRLDVLDAFPSSDVEYLKTVAPEINKKITISSPMGGGDSNNGQVEFTNAEIKSYMFSHRNEADNFHIVNLDLTRLEGKLIFAPLDSAIQCIANRGLLSVTAQTNQVLEETGMPIVPGNEHFANELAARLVLASLERQANRNSKFIVPLMSTTTANNNVQVFARVYSGSLKEVNRSVLRIANLFQCIELAAFRVIPLSSESVHTGKQGKVGLTGISPKDFGNDFFAQSEWTLGSTQIWGAPIQNHAFVTTCALENSALVEVAQQLIDVPLLYSMNELRSRFGIPLVLDLTVLSQALMNAGYSVSVCVKDDTFKTNATSQAVGECIRVWLVDNQLPLDQADNATARSFLQTNPNKQHKQGE